MNQKNKLPQWSLLPEYKKSSEEVCPWWSMACDIIISMLCKPHLDQEGPSSLNTVYYDTQL